MPGPYFTQHKQWIEFGFYNDNQGKNQSGKVGAYFERVSGGEVQFDIAEAAPANSPGRIHRPTRFRITELTLEGYLHKDTYQELMENFFGTLDSNGSGSGGGYYDRSEFYEKAYVQRRMKDGKGQIITEQWLRLSIIQPPDPEDGDVTRDTDFVMVRIRLQPDAKKKWVANVEGDGTGVLVAYYDPDVGIDGDAFNNM